MSLIRCSFSSYLPALAGLVLLLGSCSSDDDGSERHAGSPDAGAVQEDTGPVEDSGALPDEGLPDLGPQPVDAASDSGPLPVDAGPLPVDAATDLSVPADEGTPDAGNPLVACLGEDDLDAIRAAWPVGEIVRTAGRGLLAVLPTDDGPIYLPVLRGTHRQMGCQYAFLIGEALAEMWDAFIIRMVNNLLEDNDVGLSPEQVVALAETVMQALWEMMVPYVPAELLEELEGVAEGQRLAGLDPQQVDLKKILILMTTISNVSDSGALEDLEDLMDLMATGHSAAFDEYFAGQQPVGFWNLLERLRLPPAPRSLPLDEASRAVLRRIPIPRHSCSILGTWGEHTRDGHLIALRNLDWNADTGMKEVKALTFWVPEDGQAHLTVGYLGMFGALSGMNEQGIVTGEVGSTGVLERFQGTPWILKHREILMRSANLDEALGILTNTRDDGRNRPQTIGYNWLLAWGDPAHAGQEAAGSVAETNAIFTAVHRQQHDCTPGTTVHEYGPDGRPVSATTQAQDPFYANLEADAVEIDAAGQARHFQVDEAGQFVRDGEGRLVEDGNGQPFPLGRSLPCALYRGDEAMAHAARRWQLASGGPQHNNGRLLADSGSYRRRYSTLHGMLAAYRSGTAYEEDGEVLVAAGEPRPVALEEGVALARAAAMDGNVNSVAYDATALVLRVAFESGSGETWRPASANEYHEVDAGAIFRLVR